MPTPSNVCPRYVTRVIGGKQSIQFCELRGFDDKEILNRSIAFCINNHKSCDRYQKDEQSRQGQSPKQP